MALDTVTSNRHAMKPGVGFQPLCAARVYFPATLLAVEWPTSRLLSDR
jgi:hypothetical protein